MAYGRIEIVPVHRTQQRSAKPQRGEDMPQVSRQLAHALPTSRVEDPDLALIVGLWDRLSCKCKSRLIAIVHESLTRDDDADEFDEINERGG
jgi:hypothetical protein